MYYWIDLNTGEISAHGFATRGLVMQQIQKLQARSGHAFRCIEEE